MTKITVSHLGVDIEPHLFGDRAEPDRFGKRGGYRVTPPGPGHNRTENGVYYRSLDDVAGHLKANRLWGLRMRASTGQVNIYVDDIVIDGVPR